MLGEGVSSQVVLAADTFRPNSQPVAVKILKRQHSYAGQKASSPRNRHLCATLCTMAPETRSHLDGGFSGVLVTTSYARHPQTTIDPC